MVATNVGGSTTPQATHHPRFPGASGSNGPNDAEAHWLDLTLIDGRAFLVARDPLQIGV